MKQQTCYICTGKAGDILNLLPLLQHTDPRPALMVAKDYATILEGVSYVDPVVFDGHWMDLSKAVEQAKAEYAEVKVAQVAGPKKEILDKAYAAAGLKVGDPMTESFLKEQWRIAGRWQDCKLNWPLLFDMRNQEREVKLLDTFARQIRNLQPVVLYNLGAHTSPHPYSRLLRAFVQETFSTRNFRLIDLTEVEAVRLFDLLALYEKAKLLISLDTATLHLARAVPTLPVIALVQDSPSYWHGSHWRPNHILTVRYHEPDRLADMKPRYRAAMSHGSQIRPLAGPKFIHVYNDYVRDDQFEKEAVTSRETLAAKRNWVIVPADLGVFGRDTHTVWGKGSRLPYLKDVIRMGCMMAGEQDVIVLTRSDTALRRDVSDKLKESDLPVVGQRMVSTHARRQGMIHSAYDLFAFTAEWWRGVQRELPDVIMGTDPHWAKLLAHFILKHGGTSRRDLCYRAPGMIRGIVDEDWRRYNQALCDQWLKENGVNLEIAPLEKQMQIQQINPLALFPGGYNPSLLPIPGGYLCAYRAHRWNDERTCLAMAVLDTNYGVRTNNWIEPVTPGMSLEDPRLFWHKGALHMSAVESTWPNEPLRSWVIYGPISDTGGGVWQFNDVYAIQPPQPQELEKNWVFFEHQEQLFCIYASYPQYLLLEVEKEKIVGRTRGGAYHWEWGPIRGGSMPLQIGKRMFRLFHSRTNTEAGPIRWRYHVGVMEIQAVPPFKLINTGPQPILSGAGSMGTEQTRFAHFKPNVVFPGGAWIENDEVRFAFGVNDCACFVGKVDPSAFDL